MKQRKFNSRFWYLSFKFPFIVRLEVKVAKDSEYCRGCFLNKFCSDITQKQTGPCFNHLREDKTEVIFKKV